MDEGLEESEDDPPLELGTVVVVVVVVALDAVVVAVVSAARIMGAGLRLDEAKSAEELDGTRLEALVEVELPVVVVVEGGGRVVVERAGRVVVVRAGRVVVVAGGRVVVVWGDRVGTLCGCVVVVVELVVVCVTVAGGRAANPASVRAIAALMAAMEFLAWLRTSALFAARYEAINALAPAGARVEEGSVTVTRVAAPLLPTVPGTGSLTTVPLWISGPVT